MSDAFFNKLFGDSQATDLGTGWVSGTASVFFGLLGLGGVITLHFPGFLTLPEAREFYPMGIIRMIIQGTVAAALVLGAISAILRERKVLGLTGVALGLAAALFGGASTALPEEVTSKVGIGFDWFLLDLMVMTLVFVPLERLWPRHPEQGTFRPEWTTDTFYFVATHLPAQLTTFAIHRAVPAGHCHGGPVSVRHSPGLPPVLVPVALPRRASLHQDDGLDRRLTFSLRRYINYSRFDPHPHDFTRVFSGCDGRVSRLRRISCLLCDLPLSPLASCGGSGCDRR